MDALDTKRMEMFISVGKNRLVFPLAAAEGSRGAEIYDDLGQLVEELRSSSYEQSRAQSSLREVSSTIASAREGLERQLEAIRKTVRIADLPGLEDKFLPARIVPDQGLLTLSRTYENDAFPVKADLIKRGLGADFINDLSAAARAFGAALDERSRQFGKQVEATAEIDRHIQRGLRLVRELGVIVRNVYAKDPAKLALWESVSRVEKTGRRSRRAEDGDGQPTPPAEN